MEYRTLFSVCICVAANTSSLDGLSLKTSRSVFESSGVLFVNWKTKQNMKDLLDGKFDNRDIRKVDAFEYGINLTKFLCSS